MCEISPRGPEKEILPHCVAPLRGKRPPPPSPLIRDRVIARVERVAPRDETPQKSLITPRAPIKYGRLSPHLETRRPHPAARAPHPSRNARTLCAHSFETLAFTLDKMGCVLRKHKIALYALRGGASPNATPPHAQKTPRAPQHRHAPMEHARRRSIREHRACDPPHPGFLLMTPPPTKI